MVSSPPGIKSGNGKASACGSAIRWNPLEKATDGPSSECRFSNFHTY